MKTTPLCALLAASVLSIAPSALAGAIGAPGDTTIYSGGSTATQSPTLFDWDFSGYVYDPLPGNSFYAPTLADREVTTLGYGSSRAAAQYNARERAVDVCRADAGYGSYPVSMGIVGSHTLDNGKRALVHDWRCTQGSWHGAQALTEGVGTNLTKARFDARRKAEEDCGWQNRPIWKGIEGSRTWVAGEVHVRHQWICYPRSNVYTNQSDDFGRVGPWGFTPNCDIVHDGCAMDMTVIDYEDPFGWEDMDDAYLQQDFWQQQSQDQFLRYQYRFEMIKVL